MIVIDTNVLSELMRPMPDTRVVEWIGTVAPGDASTTAITIAEIGHGLRRLPTGRRRERLEEIFKALLGELGGDVLPFDGSAADSYSHIAIGREAAGRPIDPLDCMIAAVCLSRGAVLATRNGCDFEGVGIEIIDPWTT